MTTRQFLLAATAAAGLFALPALAQQGGSAAGGSSAQPQATQTAPSQGPLSGAPAARSGAGGETQGSPTAQTRDASGGMTAQGGSTATPPGATPGTPPGRTTATDRPGSAASDTATGATSPTMAVDSAALRNTRRASKIIGSNVYTSNNESIGEVEDILIPQGGDGKPVAVISVGGFLGIGSKLVAVPYERLQLNTESNRWMLPGATKESLNAQPTFSYDATAGTRG